MFYLKIAKRYLKGRNKFWFSASNLLSLIGIVIGVFAILVVSAVMNGFNSDLRKRVVGTKADIKIHNQDYTPITNYQEIMTKIKNHHSDIIGISPLCETELMLQKNNNLATGMFFGIDFELHKQTTNILDKMVVGSPTEENFQTGIIIGLDLSIELNVTVGEKVLVSSPVGSEPSPFGLLPRSKSLTIVGIFSSGMPEYDRAYIYLSLQNAQYFLNYDKGVDYLAVKTQNPTNSDKTAASIKKLLGKDYLVEDWREYEFHLFNAIKMERAVMFLVLALMIVIAAFNMTGNFTRLVTEKKEEIGILEAIGTTKKDITKIFINIGVIIGFMGSFIGAGLALIIIFLQQEYHLIKIPIPGFAIQYLPVEIKLTNYIFIPLFVILISILTTLYPVKKTMKIKPIDIIREKN